MNPHQKKLDFGNDVPSGRVEGALLGAAIGDALGWPQERPRLRLDTQPEPDSADSRGSFYRWCRKSGGRFAPHEEYIEAGEYSDDTQLLLSVARSILAGDNWIDVLTGQELPLWLLYERGGGGALKRSARSWVRGKPPWLAGKGKTQDVDLYLEAGGNGVAMRVLPHCLLSGQREASLLDEIMANGICTHGHPRALVGALLYGRAAGLMLRTQGTLGYGELIDSLLRTKRELYEVPLGNPALRDWWKAVKNRWDDGYARVWRSVVDEAIGALEICDEAMGKGALAVDSKVLTELGCFDRSVSGAGTVTSVAAVYLASRCATDPASGLTDAAHRKGTDTDTISSMLGGLLGALHGSDWLAVEWRRLQDWDYISYLAGHLCRGSGMNREDEFTAILPWTVKRNEDIRQALKARKVGRIDIGPLGSAEVVGVQDHRMLTDAWDARTWKLRTSHGQTLYVKKISRRRKEAAGPPGGLVPGHIPGLGGRTSVFISGLSDCFPEETMARDALGLVKVLFSLLLEEQAKHPQEEFLGTFQNEEGIEGFLKGKRITETHRVGEEDLVYLVKLISKFLHDLARES